MASKLYNNYKVKVGEMDWNDNVTPTFKIMLVDDTYIDDIDNHLTKADIDALGDEVTGTNYVAGGAELLNRAVNVDNTNDWAKFDADDVTWVNSTITARGAIVYLDTGVASTSILVAYIDFISNKITSGGDFVIQFHTDGVYRLG